MSFTKFFIKRPAFTIVVTLVITILGLISYKSLPLRWIPNITPPIISIQTHYSGASAELVESQITTPIEEALSNVDGIESINSNSSQAESNITLNFKLGHNMNAAVEDVRSNLNNAVLPHDIDTPVVEKASLEGMPIVFFSFSDQNQQAKEVRDYVDHFIIPSLQNTQGVATVMSFGRAPSAMRINLDPAKMAASKVTVDDVIKALAEQNIQVPSGQLRGKDRYYNVVTNETLTSTDQFNNLIIRVDQGQTIHLNNIGLAEVAPVNSDTAFRVDGQPAVAVGIVPQSTANPLEVEKASLKTFKDLTLSLPKGMKSTIIFDAATFIRASVHSVYEALFEAVVFVLFVIFLFLGNWRATFIPVITIPVCLIGTFTLLFLFHFSINTITLMAFVLAIGLVVDDAIVMLENIMRHIELGMKPLAAAIQGSREIVFPIIAMTITLAAVYTPIAFTSGILGTVFSEFALTLAGSVLVSGVIALTLTPMMCSKLLSSTHKPSAYGLWFAKQFSKWQNGYRFWLEKVLKYRHFVLILLLIIIGLGYGVYRSLPSELAPTEDESEVDVYIAAPHSASFQYTNDYVQHMETIYQQIPEVTSYLAGIGFNSPSNSFQILTLKPISQRHRSASQIADEINEKAKLLPGARINASPPPPPLTMFSDTEDGNYVGMALMSSAEYKDIHQGTEQLIKALKSNPAFNFVDSKLKWDNSQFEINIDREKASNMHVPMANITATISTLLAGRTAGKFEYGGKQYDIIVQLSQPALADMNIISQLYVRNDNNTMVPLSGLVTMQETTNPGALPHYEKMRADTLMASLAPGYTIADAVKILNKATATYLPDTIKAAFIGEAKDYLESSNKMAMTFLLALVFIYLVLVAQFESFVDPLIILLTVPLAVVGAFLSLKIMGGSLNIYSNIGLVTLIGLIAKHGILITEFANRARLEGKSVHQAVVEAALLRLRPILMTTAAMVLGALPLAMAFGPGAETRHQVGWVIVGGLLIGTFFSLIIVPVAYTYLARPIRAT